METVWIVVSRWADPDRAWWVAMAQVFDTEQAAYEFAIWAREDWQSKDARPARVYGVAMVTELTPEVPE